MGHASSTSFQPGNDAATKHGAHSKKPVLYDLLDEEEKAVWEEAAVPPDADAVVDQLFRRAAVRLLRIERYFGRVRRNKDGTPRKFTIADMTMLMPLMAGPDRDQMKLLEVMARLRESNDPSLREDAFRRMMEAMSPVELAALATGGEMPRVDPTSGKLLPAGEPIEEVE